MSAFNQFVPIAKVDKKTKTVWGYASTPTKDLDGEIITLDAIKGALPEYMKWGNVREMHRPSAVGVAKSGSHVDDTGLWFGAHIVDPIAWEKIEAGVYKGFSIGGTALKQEGNTIKALELIEISVVDRPANSDCRIEIIKSANKDGEHVVEQGTEATLIEAPNVPVDEDGQGELQLEGFGKEELSGVRKFLAKFFKSVPATEGDILKDQHPAEPYGDVTYADPGYQKDGKKRYPVDTEAHIRSAWSYIHKPGNQEPYTAEQVEHITHAVVSAWKEHISADGPPSAEKSATVVVDSRFRLAYDMNDSITKSMHAVHGLVDAFEGLRGAQRDRRFEATFEKDPSDTTLENEAGSIAARIANLIAVWATHEGKEAINETDVEDEEIPVPVIIVENAAMTTNVAKRASQKVKEHMAKALHHMGELDKCFKGATTASEALNALHMNHAMMGKAAQDGAAFDHAGAMEHLHKLRSNLMKGADHHDMATHHLECAAEAGGAEVGEGTVDAPGYDHHIEHEGMPENGYPLLDGQGDQAKKAAGAKKVKFTGMTDEQIAAYVETQSELAALKAENTVLKSFPAGTGKPVHAFNVAKGADASGIEFSGEGNTPQEKRAILTKGLEAFDINNPDEKIQSAERARAVGKAIGNMLSRPGLFGANPVFDETFRGGAAR